MQQETPDPGQELLSSAEAVAELQCLGLKIDVRTFRRWTRNGFMPAVELPNGYRKVRRADVVAIVSTPAPDPIDPAPVAA